MAVKTMTISVQPYDPGGDAALLIAGTAIIIIVMIAILAYYSVNRKR